MDAEARTLRNLHRLLGREISPVEFYKIESAAETSDLEKIKTLERGLETLGKLVNKYEAENKELTEIITSLGEQKESKATYLLNNEPHLDLGHVLLCLDETYKLVQSLKIIEKHSSDKASLKGD